MHGWYTFDGWQGKGGLRCGVPQRDIWTGQRSSRPKPRYVLVQGPKQQRQEQHM
jgi:hypothetical protein